MQDNQIIEILGLPGVGKTTLQNKIHDTLPDSIVTQAPIKIRFISRVFHACIILIRLMINYPGKVADFIFDKQGRRLLLKLGLRRSVRINMQVPNNKNVIMYDSGVIMPILSAIVEEGWQATDSKIAALLSAIPLPQLVYCLILDSAVVHQRYSKRELNRSINVDLFSKGDKWCHFICSEMEKNGVRVIRLNNNNMDETATSFVTSLNTYTKRF